MHIQRLIFKIVLFCFIHQNTTDDPLLSSLTRGNRTSFHSAKNCSSLFSNCFVLFYNYSYNYILNLNLTLRKKLTLPRTAVIISMESFPNSLLRAKSMWAFLNFLFCHWLCPLHLNCILKKLSEALGQQHWVMKPGKFVASTREFFTKEAAILIFQVNHFLNSVGRGQENKLASFVHLQKLLKYWYISFNEFILFNNLKYFRGK